MWQLMEGCDNINRPKRHPTRHLGHIITTTTSLLTLESPLAPPLLETWDGGVITSHSVPLATTYDYSITTIYIPQCVKWHDTGMDGYPCPTLTTCQHHQPTQPTFQQFHYGATTTTCQHVTTTKDEELVAEAEHRGQVVIINTLKSVFYCQYFCEYM